MNLKIPLWNGVKKNYFKQKILPFKLKQSSIKGIFSQKFITKIKYEENYSHMTPLKGSKYLRLLRKSKIDYVLRNKKDVGNCLEIGGGDSSNINFLKFKTYTICDPFIKSYSKNNIRFISDYFENINFKNKKFDTIILLSVLEHCESAEKMIKKVKKILATNGKIYVVIPNCDKQFAYADFNAFVHEHISYFTTEGIFNLFHKYNLKIENFYQKNDSAYFSASHNKKKRKKFNFSSAFKLKELEKNFLKQITKFNNFIFNNSSNIIFLGATGGINTLLYLASKKNKINYDKIRLTDNDPYKWGKFIGSHPLPILPINKIDKFDVVCISALSFSEEIVNKLKKNKVILNLYNL